ncbi:MAG: DUF1343 domain-containing protein, partial [Bacteroidota bacterium]
MKLLVIISLALLPVILWSQVLTGADQTDKYFTLLKGKHIAIVANNASMVLNKAGAPGVNLADTLFRMGFSLEKIFSPEHGFRSNSEAGAKVSDEFDSATGIKIISLYGKKKKPHPADLKQINLMVFDLQDVGVRFFTYLSTLTYVMEACAEQNIPVLILDRPNPNGFYIDGPVLEKPFASFVGLHQVPVVYGMTIGEYARMVNGEKWLKNGVRCDLKIIPLKNYSHVTRTLTMVKPSPNLTTMNAILLYPSLCFFEGTCVSVGRGTDHPFEIFGHPDIHNATFSFIPVSIPGMSLHPLYEGRKCFGTNLQAIPVSDGGQGGKINLGWLISTFREMGSDPGFFTNY